MFRRLIPLFSSHLKNLHELGAVAGNAEKLHGDAVEERLVVVRVNARPPHVLIGGRPRLDKTKKIKKIPKKINTQRMPVLHQQMDKENQSSKI